MRVNGVPIQHFLFDLDETLYPPETGLMAAISRRIDAYMRDRLGMDPATIEKLRREYYQRYGTTSRGLSLHQGIDLDDYLAFVHDVAVEDYLRPDRQLHGVLQRLDGAKAIFTNSSAEHAQRVLRALGVEDRFDRIYDIRFLGYTHKPDPRAYRKVMDALGAPGENVLLIDDLVRNLVPGKAWGMVTVLVSASAAQELSPNPGRVEADPPAGVDFVIPRVTELEQIAERP